MEYYIPLSNVFFFSPCNFLFALLFKILLKKFIKVDSLNVHLPENRVIYCKRSNQPSVNLYVLKPFSFMCRLMFDLRMGLGESYMYGEWDAKPNLKEFFDLLIANRAARKSVFAGSCFARVLKNVFKVFQSVGKFYNYFKHLIRPNSVEGSRRNIKEHYDLSNELFKLFLDESMTYSCAKFESSSDTLKQAQNNKNDIIIKSLDLNENDSVLEIGCGWGSLAIRAAMSNSVHQWFGITISQEQLKFANERIENLSLQDKIQLKFLDYRQIAGKFDKIVSIEMIEHVGHNFYSEYFSIIEKSLKSNGLVLIQTAVIPDEQYEKYIHSSDFIRKHIFPGGQLPCVALLLQKASEVGLELVEFNKLGYNYSLTLNKWNENWVNKKADILRLGRDEIFFRKWQYYFSICSSLFANRCIDNIQLLFWKKG